jgi:hypothetical protein
MSHFVRVVVVVVRVAGCAPQGRRIRVRRQHGRNYRHADVDLAEGDRFPVLPHADKAVDRCGQKLRRRTTSWSGWAGRQLSGRVGCADLEAVLRVDGTPSHGVRVGELRQQLGAACAVNSDHCQGAEEKAVSVRGEYDRLRGGDAPHGGRGGGGARGRLHWAHRRPMGCRRDDARELSRWRVACSAPPIVSTLDFADPKTHDAPDAPMDAQSYNPPVPCERASSLL